MADVSDKSLEKWCRKMKEGGVCIRGILGVWKAVFPEDKSLWFFWNPRGGLVVQCAQMALTWAWQVRGLSRCLRSGAGCPFPSCANWELPAGRPGADPLHGLQVKIRLVVLVTDIKNASKPLSSVII